MKLSDNKLAIFAPVSGILVLIAGAAGFSSDLVNTAALIAVILSAVFHAELVAHKVGEPFGTLILAVAVTVIETGLILSMMFENSEVATSLAKDTVFAACMIILNMLMGMCLIAAAKHQQQRRFTRTGVTAALSTLAALLVLTLVLPNFTTSVPGPIYSKGQLAFVAIFSLILYLTFVFVQTVGNREYFLPSNTERHGGVAVAAKPSGKDTIVSLALLMLCLFAVVLLAKSLAKPLEDAVSAVGAPHAIVGIAIAGIVLLPESVAAVRAANSDRIQTSLNLALGSALATIGLTIPVVAAASFVLDLPLSLGLDQKNIVLLALTLFVAALSLARGRITVLHGAVHLVIFAAYLVVTIIP